MAKRLPEQTERLSVENGTSISVSPLVRTPVPISAVQVDSAYLRLRLNHICDASRKSAIQLLEDVRAIAPSSLRDILAEYPTLESIEEDQPGWREQIRAWRQKCDAVSPRLSSLEKKVARIAMYATERAAEVAGCHAHHGDGEIQALTFAAEALGMLRGLTQPPKVLVESLDAASRTRQGKIGANALARTHERKMKADAKAQGEVLYNEWLDRKVILRDSMNRSKKDPEGKEIKSGDPVPE